MDLIELRQTIRRWWVHGLISFLVIAIIAINALNPVELRFSASSTLLVSPRAERFESVSTGVLRIVLPNVLVVTRSRDLHDEVADRLGALADEQIATDATFVQDSGIMTLTVRSNSYAAAVAWSVALAEAVSERYAEDEYLLVEVLDRARSASEPGPLEWIVDLTGVAILSAFASLIVMFALQRLRESGDVIARVRSSGLRVLAELVVPGRGARPSFSRDPQASSLAVSLTAALGADEETRVVIAGDSAPTVLAVMDAVRIGLEQAGLQDRYQVCLGPSLDDLPSLRMETTGRGQSIAVLDSSQRIDDFCNEVHALIDAGIPVAGVVIVHRRLFRRSAIRTTSAPLSHVDDQPRRAVRPTQR